MPRDYRRVLDALAAASAEGLGEAEALAQLGLAVGQGGKPGRALEPLGLALAYAREAGDRFLEKAALDHLGVA